MILYHGSKEVVKYPEIRKARFHKDFYFGFYCTACPIFICPVPSFYIFENTIISFPPHAVPGL